MDSDLVRSRWFLKDSIRREVDFRATDQARGVAPPALSKPAPAEQVRIALPPPESWTHVQPVDLVTAIAERISVRAYGPAGLALDELAFLLWATQGVRRQLSAATAVRTVPSAGARHPFETYLAVHRVDGLPPGIYRFLPFEFALVLERADDNLGLALKTATLGQSFVAVAPVTFVWTVVPYRTEWRYGLAAHKVIALDAGHVGQNLYLACAAVGCGTCAVAAYDQAACDALVGVDGEDEFVIYLAPVGKLPR